MLRTIDDYLFAVDNEKVELFFSKIDTDYYKNIGIEIKNGICDISISFSQHDFTRFINQYDFSNCMFHNDIDLLFNFDNPDKIWLEFDYVDIIKNNINPLYYISTANNSLDRNIDIVGKYYNTDMKFCQVLNIGKSYRYDKIDERVIYKDGNKFAHYSSLANKIKEEYIDKSYEEYFTFSKYIKYSHSKDNKFYIYFYDDFYLKNRGDTKWL